MESFYDVERTRECLVVTISLSIYLYMLQLDVPAVPEWAGKETEKYEIVLSSCSRSQND
jgi:hypothetical protein